MPFDKAFDQYESIKNDWIISQMINNLAFQLVFFGKKRELYRLGNLHGISILYFFALMQKSNKKNQSAAADWFFNGRCWTFQALFIQGHKTPTLTNRPNKLFEGRLTRTKLPDNSIHFPLFSKKTQNASVTSFKEKGLRFWDRKPFEKFPFPYS